MSSETLRGIWLIGRIDESGISTTKLALLLLSFGIAAGVTVSFIIGEVNVHPDLYSRLPPEVISKSFVWVIPLGAFVVWSILGICRATESDINKLIQLDTSLRTCTNFLRPPKWVLYTAVTVVSLLVLLSYPLSTAYLLGRSFTEAVALINASDYGLIILAYPVQLLYAIPSGLMGYVFVAQTRTLKRMARAITVDLLRLDNYAEIAHPFARILLYWIVAVALFPIGMLFIGVYDTRSLLGGLFILTVPMLPIFFSYARPILIARNKIVDRKQEELSAVLDYLSGNDDAIRQTSLAARGDSVTAADVLAHKMFIESRGEWPISPFIKRIVSFGLLPPITWIASVYLENYFL